jgi:hypothetical protein
MTRNSVREAPLHRHCLKYRFADKVERHPGRSYRITVSRNNCPWEQTGVAIHLARDRLRSSRKSSECTTAGKSYRLYRGQASHNAAAGR